MGARQRYGQRGSLELRNGLWRGRYLVDVPGQQSRRRVAVILGKKSQMTKPEARRLLQNKILENEIVIPQASTSLTFRQHEKDWELSYLVRLKPSTQATMQWHVNKHLMPRWGDTPVDLIDAEKVNEWIGTLDKLSPVTIRGIVKTLQIVLGRSFGRGKIHYPSQVEEGDEVRCFTPLEISRILKSATGQYKLLFTLAAETGMRAGELYGLHAEDIDFGRGQIHVRRSMWKAKEQLPKTKNALRVIDVQSYVLKMLKRHLGRRRDGLVFRTQIKTPLQNAYVLHKRLYPLLDELKIEHAGMHAFRHFRVSFLVEQDVPVEVIRRWIGHGSEAMMRRYTHLRSEYRQQVLSRLPRVEIAPIDPAGSATNS